MNFNMFLIVILFGVVSTTSAAPQGQNTDKDGPSRFDRDNFPVEQPQSQTQQFNQPQIQNQQQQQQIQQQIQHQQLSHQHHQLQQQYQQLRQAQAQNAQAQNSQARQGYGGDSHGQSGKSAGLLDSVKNTVQSATEQRGPLGVLGGLTGNRGLVSNVLETGASAVDNVGNLVGNDLQLISQLMGVLGIGDDAGSGSRSLGDGPHSAVEANSAPVSASSSSAAAADSSIGVAQTPAGGASLGDRSVGAADPAPVSSGSDQNSNSNAPASASSPAASPAASPSS